ncbi:MAG: phytanoyl-CoA dioxygenase family protein [Armatimonadetes bacterium]|nr:phytanoyl-CoA dioxygenase family protein [Armatimonadota bacterium]
MLTPEQVQFFRDNGYLKVEGAVRGQELTDLQAITQALIDVGPSPDMAPGEIKDYQYGTVRGLDRPVLRRIEYVYGKGDPFLKLLAHPVLLDAVQKVVGEQFVPTYDSMVVKMPGNGVEVPWHRDGGGPTLFYDDPQTGRRFPAVNFDIYLDRADETNGALWVIPGSNKDTVNRAPRLAEKSEYAAVPGAVLVPMNAGDLLLHDVTLYHGSPETHGGALRRVLYYEFRDMRFINAVHRPGPGEVAPHKWPDTWTRARLAILQKALDTRRAAGWEVPFAQHPDPALRVRAEEVAHAPTRVPHPTWDEAAAKAAA